MQTGSFGLLIYRWSNNMSWICVAQ